MTATFSKCLLRPVLIIIIIIIKYSFSFVIFLGGILVHSHIGGSSRHRLPIAVNSESLSIYVN